MLDSLVTSKTRIKILLKFFANPGNTAHLRGLAEEFNESTNGVRVELNRLAEANLLTKFDEGRAVKYKANTKHSMFKEISSIVKKYIGFETLIDELLAKLGNVELAMVTGDYARGIDSGLIDLVLVGDIDGEYLEVLINKTEELISRKIRPLILTKEELNSLSTTLDVDRALVVWDAN